MSQIGLVYCHLWVLYVYETFHSFQHCFYKINISHFLIFELSFFYCTLTAANVQDFKGNSTVVANSFFFSKLLFLTLTNSYLKVYYAIALKFSAKQFNLLTKKSISAICEIMKINVVFTNSVNASHSLFLKKHQNTNNIKIKFFLEIHGCEFQKKFWF